MFRFTIRDVLWLMVVVGMGVAWSLDHELQSKFWWKFHDQKYRGWEQRHNEMRDNHFEEVERMHGVIRDSMQEIWQLEQKNRELQSAVNQQQSRQ